ncbi:S-ribosylhomocysteine lyase [Pseudodesulfovibrio sp. JC047]|uniref:S-ribosylhomocysteine lyase n=1 Tax=Pseudodesulfovibrio sp. JC047 TaxID=2683199 RepID=UPI0013D86121|nr:S-ribosylhomocysteine lyase [Pseudodesulfovibrio sp. JC047]NDV18370.1 S-ribosylhomocysteine lyase [Pseudodesulfovibrio sp. JC047]
MKKIASFTIDHTKLHRGVYVSRTDLAGTAVVTTFDLRMKEPNREPALAPEAAHAIEHIGATFLRNHPHYKDQVIYFGPMGCLTGFYLVLSTKCSSREILPLIQEVFQHVAAFDGDIPGASPVECGNYRFMDLNGARQEAARYSEEVLSAIQDENLVYPE